MVDDDATRGLSCWREEDDADAGHATHDDDERRREPARATTGWLHSFRTVVANIRDIARECQRRVPASTCEVACLTRVALE
jgi:hypothetical protein